MAGVVVCGPLATRAPAASIFANLDPTTAYVLADDPSTRSIGMGGASTAVFWGQPDPWANPALIATTEGVRFEHDDADYDIVHLHASRFIAGGAGLGVATSGRPIDGLGRLSLDGPTVEIVGVETISAFERVRSWSIAGSAAGLWSAWARHTGHDAPRFTRVADVAVGYSQHGVEEGFSASSGDLVGHGVVHDLGVLARAGGIVWRSGEARLGLDGAAAYSNHNSGRDGVDVFGPGTLAPAFHQERVGLAARATLDRPWAGSWLLERYHPLVSLGFAYDPVHNTSNRIDDWGAELGLGGVLFARLGQTGSAQRSWGLGVALPIGRFGGASYDYARTKQTNGLIDHVTHNSFGVWVDPLAIWRVGRLGPSTQDSRAVDPGGQR